jgi:ABC-type polysaccharide/polyol phosphate export permease
VTIHRDPVPTPGGVVGDLFRYRALVRNLVLKDLKLKYRDSALGVAWSLAHPLLLLLVYTVAFRKVLRVPVEPYGFFLLVALLPWNFFAAATLASTGAIHRNGALLRKVAFPREALPVAGVLFAFAQLLLAFVVFLPLAALVSRVDLGWTALLVVPLLLLHLTFTIGVALVLSALTVSWRDVAHFTEIALVLAFWLTPIVYPAQMAPETLRQAFVLSPPAAFAMAYQDVLFWGRLPAAGTIASAAASAVLALALGRTVFRAMSPAFVEEV